MKLDQIAIFIVKTILGITEAFLAGRFFLKILGASARAPFVRWVYNISDSLTQPFNGMFPTPSLGDIFVIDFNTIFAMIVYAIVGFFVIKVVDFIYKHIFEDLEKVKTDESKTEERPRSKEPEPTRPT